MKNALFYTKKKQYINNALRFMAVFACIGALLSCSPEPEKTEQETPTQQKNEGTQAEVAKKETLRYILASIDEARHASAMLSPRTQGIQSFKEYAVPLERNIKYLKSKKPTDLGINLPSLKITWGELLETAEELLRLLPLLDSNPSLLAERFNWYKPSPTILFTGYYEPVIKASRKKTDIYKYPIYSTPKDMKVLQLGQFHPSLAGKRIIYRIENNTPVPYYSRKQIDSDKALKNKSLEIAYADSLVDIFFLHIQGSGQIHYDDGTKAYILYASQTGREYVSLGSVMQKKEHLKAGNVNMATIREFLANNPHTVSDLLNTNPSYVFFREAKEGLFGSIAQKLTPWQSIAVDRTTIPYGGVGIVDIALLEKVTKLPEYAKRTRTINGLVFAQDTGGAIRGNRIDLFCGPGDVATDVAGFLAGRNPFWLLLKKKPENKNPVKK